MAKVTFENIKNNNVIKTYIKSSNNYLKVLGFTEHSFTHAERTARISGEILEGLGYSARDAELARIAGYMHDIGNIVNRHEHAQSGAIIAFRLLDKLDMDPNEIAEIVSAIGNHDEGTGSAVNTISAALILADKSDVRRSRVANEDIAKFDIHDRVNYAVYSSSLKLEKDKESITLELKIDNQICPVMEYFEIFLQRMLMCKKASEFLKIKFHLVINGVSFL